MEQNKQDTALLVMDMQTAVLNHLPDASTVIANVVKAVAYARGNNIPVFYVVVGFRQGAPEVSPNNKGFFANREMFANVKMEDFIKIHPAVAPLGNELTIIKRRVSAFSGSDLEIILKASSIQHILLTGIATSGVVLSTLREASDKDYRITVLTDGCADRDEEVHQVLTTKVFPRQADTLTVEEWIRK
jgi:nicotinamidase-related amidase